jgi:hypothetical protein
VLGGPGRRPTGGSRGDCDSFEPSPEIIADFVAVAMECRPGALGVLDELVMKAQTAIAPE